MNVVSRGAETSHTYRIQGWRFMETPSCLCFRRTWINWLLRLGMFLMSSCITAAAGMLALIPLASDTSVPVLWWFCRVLGWFGVGATVYVLYWLYWELREGRAEHVLNTQEGTFYIGSRLVCRLAEIAGVEVVLEQSRGRLLGTVAIRFREPGRRPYRFTPLHYGVEPARKIATVLAARLKNQDD